VIGGGLYLEIYPWVVWNANSSFENGFAFFMEKNWKIGICGGFWDFWGKNGLKTDKKEREKHEKRNSMLAFNKIKDEEAESEPPPLDGEARRLLSLVGINRNCIIKLFPLWK